MHNYVNYSLGWNTVIWKFLNKYIFVVFQPVSFKIILQNKNTL